MGLLAWKRRAHDPVRRRLAILMSLAGVAKTLDVA